MDTAADFGTTSIACGSPREVFSPPRGKCYARCLFVGEWGFGSEIGNIGAEWKAGASRMEGHVSESMFQVLSSGGSLQKVDRLGAQVNLAVCTYFAKLISSFEGPPLSRSAWE